MVNCEVMEGEMGLTIDVKYKPRALFLIVPHVGCSTRVSLVHELLYKHSII